ncbi:MAG: hypothetical protein IKF39_00855, partial [Oscillospiraceae bacterium]|nr:hypothetical protein [Oscillospiraceae bacterium]
EKLLDSIFQDTAWDISSDISVLNTMLAQEGLKEDDFSMGSPSGHKGFGTMGSQPQGQVQAMTLNSTEEKGMTL